MFDRNQLIEALARAAAAWSDPDYPKRQKAVGRTLKASNSFTEEAVAFAVNQQMALLTGDALSRWAPSQPPQRPRLVGVLNAGNIPFVELQDFLAVLLAGHRYVGTVSSRSPALLPAFAADLDGVQAEFVDADELFGRADAVITTGSDETAAWVESRCDEAGILSDHRLIRGHRFAAAVVDGRESESELEALAEDALLHEGFGCRNVALIWAPAGHSPDALLEAFAHFRGVFPAHEGTPGRLKMQQAFLEAVDAPHAYGEGLEFLLSKGDPEPQQPGHIRWAEYAHIHDVVSWLENHRDALQLVVARAELQRAVQVDVPIVAPGETQRPSLDWCPDGKDVMSFLKGLQ